MDWLNDLIGGGAQLSSGLVSEAELRGSGILLFSHANKYPSPVNGPMRTALTYC
jgi:hypothetical protein